MLGKRVAATVLTALPMDAALDAVFPDWARAPSRKHWTPTRVARRAADWLAHRPGTRILDVGSGAGKFCLVGAMATEGTFVGVEQRKHLVTVARQAAKELRLARCRFVHGDISEIDWDRFDGIYLYNPFAEQLEGFGLIDETIAISDARFRRYVHFVRGRLRDARPGTRLVTFHGFGAEPPRGWTRIDRDWVSGGPLEFWMRNGRASR